MPDEPEARRRALFDAATPEEAAALQSRLAAILAADPGRPPLAFDCGGAAAAPRVFGGVDVSYDATSGEAIACAALWDAERGAVIETAFAQGRPGFPYAPGVLAFRETPLALEAAEGLRGAADVWLYDGNGRWHPRGFGAACHFGLARREPTIGVAKNPSGPAPSPDPPRGSVAWVLDERDGRPVAAALRTQTGVKPVYVSVGYGLSLEAAAAWARQAAPSARVPDPIRAADRASRAALVRAAGRR